MSFYKKIVYLMLFYELYNAYPGFPGGTVAKNPPINAVDMDSIPVLGRFTGEGDGNPSSILAWKIPWAENPGRLQSMGLQRVGHDWAYTYTHTHNAYA